MGFFSSVTRIIFFFQAEDGIRDTSVTGVQTCALPISGAYPWGNHENAWRPAHIHFSLFGRTFTQRLVTQMYFPGDPLFPYDPIFNSVRDPRSRELLVARFDLDATAPEWALGFQWDIVLGRGGRGTTPFEEVA